MLNALPESYGVALIICIVAMNAIGGILIFVSIIQLCIHLFKSYRNHEPQSYRKVLIMLMIGCILYAPLFAIVMYYDIQV